MPDIGLTHVALPASDLDRSVEFYASYANMSVVHRRENVVWLSDGTRPFAIVLARAETVERPLGPFAHLGVACGSPEEVDRLCARAREDGRLDREPHNSGPPVGYWAFIRDPDGHILELSYGQEVARTCAT
jgi:catechol 2,3-dioxygenase-like lactoylglutathione lyase family enzyme